MTLTPEDTKIIKNLLNEVKEEINANIERKINTLTINFEREIGNRNLYKDTATELKLKGEIRASEDNLK